MTRVDAYVIKKQEERDARSLNQAWDQAPAWMRKKRCKCCPSGNFGIEDKWMYAEEMND